MNEELQHLSKKELIGYIEDLSKNWLAIDGTWFQAVEKEYGLDKAMESISSNGSGSRSSRPSGS